MAEVQAPNPIASGITDLHQRLRVLEERYIVLRRKGQLSDENLLTSQKDIEKTIEKLNAEITALRHMLADIDEKLDRFLQQVKNTAPRKDILAIRKYLEMWEPLRFLTQEEALRLIRREKGG